MTMTWNLDNASNASFGSEKQMFANAVEPSFQGGAMAFSSKAFETSLFTSPYGSANVYGVGVDDEKGGFSSPSRVISAFERF